MSMGGALELIQSFNNPKIIDAPDSSLQEGKPRYFEEGYAALSLS